jgi:hypothetical protein
MEYGECGSSQGEHPRLPPREELFAPRTHEKDVVGIRWQSRFYGSKIGII